MRGRLWVAIPVVLVLVWTTGSTPAAFGQTFVTSARATQTETGRTFARSADTTFRGVVWTPPDAPGAAFRELNRIHALGATAVRLTSLPPASTVFARADSLGLRLFVDLPVSNVGASALRDSLTQAETFLTRLRETARTHRSVKHVGLARNADTTVPVSCRVLREWTKQLHAAPGSLRTYYVTPFRPSAERCADATDLVLFDVRGHGTPVQRWRDGATDSSRTGLGALGTWVHPAADSGLHVPHSPERQARHLERALSRLLDSAGGKPRAVFVYRWKDVENARLSTRRYGLHDTSSSPRPAARVVKGFYTDTQRVFAFPSGTAPSSYAHGLILLGWGLVVLVALLFAGRPYVRQTAYRYFVTHGFFRDAVREGREVAPGLNTLLLVLSAIATGIIATVLARLAAASPTTEHVLSALPSVLRTPLATGVTQPVVTGVVVGGLTTVLLGGWAVALALTARFTSPFSVSQAVMLVAWPCWPVLPGVVLALVAATNPPLSTMTAGGLLAGGAVLVSVGVVVRVLRDYHGVTDVPLPVTIMLALPSPPVLVGLILFVVTAQYELPLALLWHLLTRT